MPLSYTSLSPLHPFALWHNRRMGITPQQFEQMKRRLDERKPRGIPAPPRQSAREPQVILGIDPSLRGTGFGMIRTAKPHPEVLVFGTIACPSRWEHSRCLMKIAQTLREVLRQHRPSVCVVEGLFYAQNLQTALIMGEARGASLATVAEAGVEIYEIAPRKVKQAIVGYGAAQKTAVAKMVQRMLELPEAPPADAADALALALVHVQEINGYSLTSRKRI
jgi:crossover junction endodeoxyribonuclease RuvC